MAGVLPCHSQTSNFALSASRYISLKIQRAAPQAKPIWFTSAERSGSHQPHGITTVHPRYTSRRLALAPHTALLTPAKPWTCVLSPFVADHPSKADCMTGYGPRTAIVDPLVVCKDVSWCAVAFFCRSLPPSLAPIPTASYRTWAVGAFHTNMLLSVPAPARSPHWAVPTKARCAPSPTAGSRHFPCWVDKPLISLGMLPA